MSEIDFNRVAIIGLGLIGGSIAAALKQRGQAEVVAWDTNPASLETGLKRGVIDAAVKELGDAVRNADLIVLAVPVLSIPNILEQLPLKDQVLTDVGSVKGYVIDAAKQAFGELPPNFVPGHPIAGSEQHGVGAANPNLFENHRVILTPLPETEGKAVDMVNSFWRALGAEVEVMAPDHHDSMLAQTSHLPHLLAYGLVDTLSKGGSSLEVFQYAAGGFRDFSRIAASDPVMWRDVFLTNPEPVLKVLDQYLDEMGQLRDMIADGDGDKLLEVFARAKAARDHFSDITKKGQS